MSSTIHILTACYPWHVLPCPVQYLDCSLPLICVAMSSTISWRGATPVRSLTTSCWGASRPGWSWGPTTCPYTLHHSSGTTCPYTLHHSSGTTCPYKPHHSSGKTCPYTLHQSLGTTCPYTLQHSSGTTCPYTLQHSSGTKKWTVSSKEYISLVEQTATPDRLTKSPLTQPLPVRSVQKGR